MKQPSLLVVSHTPHHREASGRVVGFGATVRELDVLASLFGRVVHLAPCEHGEGPSSALPYRAPNLEILPLPATGGPRLRDKVAILRHSPAFWRELAAQVEQADLVHVRAPANVAWLAMLAHPRLPHRPWWVKYAGNWRPEGGTEAFSYRRQRAWCARPRPGVRVTVNGRWPDQPAHVVTFRNPCLHRDELERATAVGASKELSTPVRLLYVGRIEEPKGAPRALATLARLRARGIDARLDLAGGGPLREALEAEARAFGEACRFHGELPRPALDGLYAEAHFLVLPTRSSEGWPKVLAEAMAWGALPLAGDVSSIPQILGELAVGRALPAADPELFAGAVADYSSDPGRYRVETRRAALAAAEFTYDRYLADVSRLLSELLPRQPNPEP